MTHEEPFLRALAAEPNDEDLLMVFADWLDERDDPRAESIRALVQLSQRPIDDPLREELQEEFQESCDRAAEVWLGPLHGYVISWRVVRGLLQIRARAESLFLLRENPEARRIFARVSLLDLVGEVDVVLSLLELPEWLTLSTLDLGCNGLQDVDAGQLACSPPMARLSTLLLYDNEIGYAGALLLSRSPYLSRLRELDLRRNKFGNEGALALAVSPTLHPKIRLHLEGNEINHGRVIRALKRRLKGARW